MTAVLRERVLEHAQRLRRPQEQENILLVVLTWKRFLHGKLQQTCCSVLRMHPEIWCIANSQFSSRFSLVLLMFSLSSAVLALVLDVY